LFNKLKHKLKYKLKKELKMKIFLKELLSGKSNFIIEESKQPKQPKQKVQDVGKGNGDDLEKEIRYTLDVDDKVFKTIPPIKEEGRTDWYFPTYRIRKFDMPNDKSWRKITGAAGLTYKKNVKIKKQDVKKLDEECLYKLEMISKRPVVDNIQLYFEKVTIYKNNKKKIIYSSEVETKEGKKTIKKLLKIPGIKNLKNWGEIPLGELVQKFI